jgi:transcriptional regulator of acetoin/glycerol metabolism
MGLEETQRGMLSEVTEAPATHAPFLFLVLACHDPSLGASRWSLEDVDEVRFGRAVAEAGAPMKRGAKLVKEKDARVLVVGVADALMSSTHARIVREDGDFVLEDKGSTNGTRIDGSRIQRAVLADGAVFQLGTTLFLFRESLLAPPGTAPMLDKKEALAVSTMIPAHEPALASFAQVARSNVPILLLGESGTGKEVLARAAHSISGRRGGFVPVNCGGLPETLLESQLFGHVKGAFSGAVKDEPGFVRASDKGTLFLDEIGDMPKTSQAALLRVLQEREVTPVGSTTPVKVDLRIVAATHRRVDALHGETGFRADLYARLAGLTHELVPLRDRREDIGLLVKALLAKVAPGRELALAPDLGRALLAYDWPLNVRELEQCLSVAAVLAEDVIKLAHLPEPLRRAMADSKTKRDADAKANAEPGAADEALRDRLEAQLKAHAGNVSEIARSMGHTRMQIHRWMKRFGLDPETFRK